MELERRREAFALLRYFKNQGLSRKMVVDCISEEFKIPKSTVYLWFSGNQSPLRTVGKIRTCPEIFYVLGALLGDGCMYRWKRKAGYKVILGGDRAFAAKYARKLSVCIGRKVKAYVSRSQNNFWFVVVCNGELYILFKNLRMSPRIVFDMMCVDDFERNALEFVSGFFDAEGCVKLICEKARKTPKICPDITNTNREYLEIVRILLLVILGIEARYSVQRADGKMRKKKVYHLRIYKKEYVRKFFKHIKTTKLQKKKRYAVKKWLSVPNCHPAHSCNSR